MRRHRRIATLLATSLVLSACGGVGGGAEDEEEAPQGSQGGDKDGGAEPGSITTMGFGLPDEVSTARVDRFK